MKPGRWYAMPGEGGLLMCTFPDPHWTFENAKGQGNTDPGFAGYFNECMNGFEYQVAGHMLWEGMLTEGLAIARMIHDRYHPSRRNPWNEVECGDHYARSMASYGVYLAACGCAYHGPQGHLGFAPRWSADNFRCAFTAAEGWGTFSQEKTPAGQRATLHLRWGRLQLRSLSLAVLPDAKTDRLRVAVNGREVAASPRVEQGTATAVFERPVILEADQTLELILSLGVIRAIPHRWPLPGAGGISGASSSGPRGVWGCG